jgi:hypothetical protein
MANERLSVFDTTDDVDLTGFTPRPDDQKKLKPPKEKVRAVTEAARFPSREGRAPAAETPIPPAVPEPSKRKPHYHKTGRTAQLNCRVMPAHFDKVYAIADQQGWKIGETVERALDALERELAKGEGEGRRGS